MTKASVVVLPRFDLNLPDDSTRLSSNIALTPFRDYLLHRHRGPVLCSQTRKNLASDPRLRRSPLLSPFASGPDLVTTGLSPRFTQTALSLSPRTLIGHQH